jgi:hypothetical protein
MTVPLSCAQQLRAILKHKDDDASTILNTIIPDLEFQNRETAVVLIIVEFLKNLFKLEHNMARVTRRTLFADYPYGTGKTFLGKYLLLAAVRYKSKIEARINEVSVDNGGQIFEDFCANTLPDLLNGKVVTIDAPNRNTPNVLKHIMYEIAETLHFTQVAFDNYRFSELQPCLRSVQALIVHIDELTGPTELVSTIWETIVGLEEQASKIGFKLQFLLTGRGTMMHEVYQQKSPCPPISVPMEQFPRDLVGLLYGEAKHDKCLFVKIVITDEPLFLDLLTESTGILILLILISIGGVIRHIIYAFATLHYINNHVDDVYTGSIITLNASDIHEFVNEIFFDLLKDHPDVKIRLEKPFVHHATIFFYTLANYDQVFTEDTEIPYPLEAHKQYFVKHVMPIVPFHFKLKGGDISVMKSTYQHRLVTKALDAHGDPRYRFLGRDWSSKDASIMKASELLEMVIGTRFMQLSYSGKTYWSEAVLFLKHTAAGKCLSERISPGRIFIAPKFTSSSNQVELNLVEVQKVKTAHTDQRSAILDLFPSNSIIVVRNESAGSDIYVKCRNTQLHKKECIIGAKSGDQELIFSVVQKEVDKFANAGTPEYCKYDHVLMMISMNVGKEIRQFIDESDTLVLDSGVYYLITGQLVPMLIKEVDGRYKSLYLINGKRTLDFKTRGERGNTLVINAETYSIQGWRDTDNFRTPTIAPNQLQQKLIIPLGMEVVFITQQVVAQFLGDANFSDIQKLGSNPDDPYKYSALSEILSNTALENNYVEYYDRMSSPKRTNAVINRFNQLSIGKKHKIFIHILDNVTWENTASVVRSGKFAYYTFLHVFHAQMVVQVWCNLDGYMSQSMVI